MAAQPEKTLALQRASKRFFNPPPGTTIKPPRPISVRPSKPRHRRVLVHGLPYFARMFADLMSGDGWEFRFYPDSGLSNLVSMARELFACDIAYQIGGRVTLGRFLHAARAFGKKKIVMHWVGSDTLDERKVVARRRSSRWVINNVFHWADSEWLTNEVETLGLSCERMPLPSSLIPEKPCELPSEFSVLVYIPDIDRSYLYGLDRVLQVARELPQVQFELVGLRNGSVPDPPPNLRIHGRIPDLGEFYRRACVVWRPVRHDGLSFMVLEALGHGRHVLWSYAFPGCRQVHDVADARAEILRLQALHRQQQLGINTAGVRAITEGGYLPRALRARIRARLDQILES